MRLEGNSFKLLLQALLEACSKASWADFSNLHIDRLSTEHDRLQLVPTAAARCFGCPLFGLTATDRRLGKLARRPQLEVLSIVRPVDEATRLPPDKLSNKLFDDIATYFPQCAKAWQHIRALSAECHNEIVFDVEHGSVLFPHLRVLALQGQFSLLDLFELANTGPQGQLPQFAPLLDRCVFKLGHGLSELVTERTLRFPDLSHYSHLKLLALEECMVRLPIPATRLPDGLEELIMGARDVSRLGQVVRGQLPPTTSVRLVQIGSPEFDECMRPYFLNMCALSTLVGVLCPDWRSEP